MKLSLIAFALIGAVAVAGEVYRVPLKQATLQSKSELTQEHRLRGSPISAPIVLHDFQNMLYHGELTVGDQQFEVMWDTGSSKLWVPSAECDSCGNHKKYDYTKSKTYVEDDTGKHPYHEIYYGSGYVSGFLSKDDVRAGDIHIPQLDFVEVTDASCLQGFNQKPFDGVIGLASPFVDIERVGMEPLFTALVRQGLVKNPVFTFLLGQQHGHDGELVLGGIDEAQFKGDIFYVPLMATDHRWSVKLDAVKAGSKLIDDKAMAIVDTGNSLIKGPFEKVLELAAKLGAEPLPADSSLHVLPCDMKGLPDISFSMGGQDLVITPQDYLLGGKFPGRDNICLLGFLGGANVHWVLGDVFLRKYFTVFDYGNKRMGFAEPQRHGDLSTLLLQ